MASLYERRCGQRKLALESTLAPATRWDPVLPGIKIRATQERFVRSHTDPGRSLQKTQDIAFCLGHAALTVDRGPQAHLRASDQYLSRSSRAVRSQAPLRDHADPRARARAGEAAPTPRSPPANIAVRSHGIPWGVKDLLDTAGIPTTYGAEPFRDRVPADDAAVVAPARIGAGAVLVAKLSLGALALNDIWFGGQTMNPWLLEEGASGSSAGPGAATAAGCVGFSIGSETGGSIVAPAMRCGVTGLRPTFGRVPRTGAMTLCWSLDKLGPMTRHVEDAMLVLHAITGPDAGDRRRACRAISTSTPPPPSQGLRVGYFPQWIEQNPGHRRRSATPLEHVKKLGMTPREVQLPNWPYDSHEPRFCSPKAAAAFEELTLTGGMNQLKAQVPDAWPNVFREARFLSAVDFVQADRMRRKVARGDGAAVFARWTCCWCPSLRDEMLTIANFTGHPSLTTARRIHRSTESPQRLGAGSEQPAADLLRSHAASRTASPSSAASSRRARSAPSASHWKKASV